MFNRPLPSLQEFVTMAVAFLVALTVHEYAHARAALAAGDDTAKQAGRISLNPIDHLDPLGTIMFAFMLLNGFGIAWGKPVPVNPMRFKSPRWDNLKVSIWGPASNLITAVAFGIIFRIVDPHIPYTYDTYRNLLAMIIMFNLMLAFFNMIPVPPLDGSHVLSSLLPVDKARRFDIAMGKYGMLILLAILFTGIVGRIIGPPVEFLFVLITGLN
ncbi:MAG: site-2 protease family protein [Armatimonadota bacterium]